MSTGLIVLLAGAGVVVLFALIMYNSLIGKKNMVEQAFSSVDVMLKKRYDLIPNLVAAVQTYMKHEAGTLTKIAELRGQAMAPNATVNDKVQIENQMSGMLRGIMVQVENYPNLKANENFMQLQGSLNENEEQISAARRAFNASVLDYNNAVEMFPTNIMASLMSYKTKPMFVIPEIERQAPNVKNLFNS